MPSGPPQPIQQNAASLDLSTRFFQSKTVSASPPDDTITVVASVAVPQNLVIAAGAQIWAWLSVALDGDASAVTVALRKTNAAGAVVATSDPIVVAGAFGIYSINGFDTTPSTPGQVYALCVTVQDASGASTVSAVSLAVLVV